MNSLIKEGVKVKGFAFADGYYNQGRLRFNPQMKELCEVEGEVFRVDEVTGLCGIQFGDSTRTWYYPIEVAVNHIVNK